MRNMKVDDLGVPLFTNQDIVNLISEFDETTFAIMKHNNACGVSSRESLEDIWNEFR